MESTISLRRVETFLTLDPLRGVYADLDLAGLCPEKFGSVTIWPHDLYMEQHKGMEPAILGRIAAPIFEKYMMSATAIGWAGTVSMFSAQHRDLELAG